MNGDFNISFNFLIKPNIRFSPKLIIKNVKKRAFSAPFKNVKIEVAKLGDKNAGILGAARLVII